MDGGVDGGSVDDDGGDVDVVAFVSRAFSYSWMKGVAMVDMDGRNPPAAMDDVVDCCLELGLPLLV